MHGDAERALLAEAKGGNATAFEALWRANRDGAYRLAYRMTRSHADADDVLQDAWLRAYRGLAGFDGRSQFGTWFMRIVLRAAMTHLRKRQRRPAPAQLASAGAVPSARAESDPAGRASAGELQAALDDAVAGLSLNLRGALALVVFEGMSYAEAARVQQCPEGTLAWRVAEARRRLADKLAPYLD